MDQKRVVAWKKEGEKTIVKEERSKKEVGILRGLFHEKS